MRFRFRNVILTPFHYVIADRRFTRTPARKGYAYNIITTLYFHNTETFSTSFQPFDGVRVRPIGLRQTFYDNIIITIIFLHSSAAVFYVL